MKRLQIYLDPEADDALAAESARTGVSKAAIIRGLVAAHTGAGKTADPIDALVGAFEGPVGDIDDIVYGR